MLTVEARFDRHFLKIAELKNTASSPSSCALNLVAHRHAPALLTLLVLQAFRSRPVVMLSNYLPISHSTQGSTGTSSALPTCQQPYPPPDSTPPKWT